MTVFLILVSKFLLFNVTALLQNDVIINNNKPEPLPTIQIRTLKCPNLCKGEEFYSITYSLSSEYTLTSSSGTVVADSIVGITPSLQHTVILTITDKNNVSTTEEILLPTCEFEVPEAPLVSNASICKGEPIPSLSAFVASPKLTVDWYNQAEKGTKLASGLSFTPTNAGTYYASSRNLENDCISTQRTPANIIELAPPCIQVTVRLIRD